MMKKILVLIILGMIIPSLMFAQTISIKSPSDLTEPYLIDAGSTVTIEFYYYGSAGIVYSSDSEINAEDYPSYAFVQPDDSWTANVTSEDPEGLQTVDIVVNEESWLIGYVTTGMGDKLYTSVIHIQTQNIVYPITSLVTEICSSDGSVILTAPSGYSYQWYLNGEIISAATSETYNATVEGSYTCDINDGVSNMSNAIVLTNYEASFLGSYSAGELTLTAEQTYDSYKWYSGSNSESLIEINGATSANYVATLTESETFYAFEGISADACAVMSSVRSASISDFIAPEITLNADENSYGKICDGEEVNLSYEGTYTNVEWYKNGDPTGNTEEVQYLYSTYNNGEYTLGVIVDNWNEILVFSNAIDVEYYKLTTPALSGSNLNDKFCPGEEINIYLDDLGYNYRWYIHSGYDYTEDDLIENPGSVYSFIFDTTVSLTVVAEFQGCSIATTKTIRSYSELPLIINVENYDSYLCIGGSKYIFVGSYYAESYSSFQWFVQEDENWVAIDGEVNDSLFIDEVGSYRVEGVVAACEDITVISGVVEILDYTENLPSIYAEELTICEDGSTVIRISGSDYWTNIQWKYADLQVGEDGVERYYVPSNGETSSELVVNEWGSYTVSAKNVNCPDGLKVESEPVTITPSVMPVITADIPLKDSQNHMITWAEPVNYLTCEGSTVVVTVENPEFYESITWYETAFSTDSYEITGDPIGTGSSVTIAAYGNWITAVTSIDGCMGQSEPILIDTWIQSSPSIASVGNSELCEIGDSTIAYLAFPGDWDSFQWFNNGVAIDGATNDTIYAKEEGMYTLTAYSSLCEGVGYSSGTGPVVTIMVDATIEENDTCFYAMPELGIYTYQWYYNGEAMDMETFNLPWVLPKDGLAAGTYTVDVTNDIECLRSSDELVWVPNSIDNSEKSQFRVYPNPTSGILNIDNISDKIEIINIYNMLSVNLRTISNPSSNEVIDISGLNAGMYIVEFVYSDGTREVQRISKQ